MAEQAKQAGPQAIDATVGMILNEDGIPEVLPCVRAAAREWAGTFATGDFAYPPLLGVPAFRSAVTRLIFGDEVAFPVASIASTGGTGAVALLLRLLKLLRCAEVILPVPTWGNHRRMVQALGMAVRDVPYIQGGRASLAGVEDALTRSSGMLALLLQACGHNPTGLDPTEGEWRALAQSLKGTGHVVLLDMAYQGLARGTEEDALPARMLAEAGVPLFVAWSASKNHSLYGLRTGLACAVAPDAAVRDELERHLMVAARELHSASPVAGQYIAALVQQNSGEEWRRELEDVRASLQEKRSRLTAALPACSAALAGSGLYALLPLCAAQVTVLREKQVFLTQDGRVNIAGIPLSRLEEFCAAVRSTLELS